MFHAYLKYSTCQYSYLYICIYTCIDGVLLNYFNTDTSKEQLRCLSIGTMADAETLIHSVIDLLDVLVDLYLGTLVRPFLRFHDDFHANINKMLRRVLDDNRDKMPHWLTSNASANVRLLLVFPTILFLAWGNVVFPMLFVFTAHFMGLLDSVLSKFWADAKRDLPEEAIREDDRPTGNPGTHTDDDNMDTYEFGELVSCSMDVVFVVDTPSFFSEVVTTGSPQRMKSWSLAHRYRSYAAFLDEVCDKAFIIPCWIYLLSTVPSGKNRSIKYITLLWLIVAEVANGCLQFKTFYSSSGVHQVEGAVLMSSSISVS